MNCQTALETLELVRPDAPGAARVAEAAQHVSGCVSCRAAVRQREEVDARIGGLCRDVPIPIGLKERLLARIDAHARNEIAGEGAAVSSGPEIIDAPVASDELATTMPALSTARALPRVVGARRRWLGVVSLTVASVIALGIGTWSLWPRPAVDLEEITGLMTTAGIDPTNLAEFTTFAGGLAPPPPQTMLTGGLLVRPPRRLGAFEAAIYFFKHGKLDGRLAVIPRHFVNARDMPSATSLLSASITYRPGFCTISWVEGDFVYIFCLSGGESDFRQLVPPRPQPV